MTKLSARSTSMIGRVLTFLCGVVFAFGLGISEMTRPEKVLAFLDVLGDWDPSLLVVMAAGIGAYYPLQRLIRSSGPPYCVSDYTLPKEGLGLLDSKLYVGAAIFGLGWGLLGLCPGPSVTIIATLEPGVFVFLIACGVGMLAAHRYRW